MNAVPNLEKKTSTRKERGIRASSRDIGTTTNRRNSVGRENSAENSSKDVIVNIPTSPPTRSLRSTAISEKTIELEAGLLARSTARRGSDTLQTIDRKSTISQGKNTANMETDSKTDVYAKLPPIKKASRPGPSHVKVVPGPSMNPTAVYYVTEVGQNATESPGPSAARSQNKKGAESGRDSIGLTSVTKLPQLISKSRNVTFTPDEGGVAKDRFEFQRRLTKSMTELQEYFSRVSYLDREQRAEAMAEAVMEVAEGKAIGSTRKKKTQAEKTRAKKDLQRKNLKREEAARRMLHLELEQRMAELYWPVIKHWKIEEKKKREVVFFRAEGDMMRTYYSRVFETQDHLMLMLVKETLDTFLHDKMSRQTYEAYENLESWFKVNSSRIGQNYIDIAITRVRNMTKRSERILENHSATLPYLTTKYTDADLAEFRVKMDAELYSSRETGKEELQQELFEMTSYLNLSKKELKKKLEREIIPYVKLVQQRKRLMEPNISRDQKNLLELQDRILRLERLEYEKHSLKLRLNFRKAHYKVFHEQITERRQFYEFIENKMQQKLREEKKSDAKNLKHLVTRSNDCISWLNQRVEKAELIFTWIRRIKQLETTEESMFSCQMTRRIYETEEEKQKFDYGEPQTHDDLAYCHETCNAKCSEDEMLRKFYRRLAKASYTTDLIKIQKKDLAQENEYLQECIRSITSGENDDNDSLDIRMTPIVPQPRRSTTNCKGNRTRPKKQPDKPGPSS